jgi:hypothetical protein
MLASLESQKIQYMRAEGKEQQNYPKELMADQLRHQNMQHDHEYKVMAAKKVSIASSSEKLHEDAETGVSLSSSHQNSVQKGHNYHLNSHTQSNLHSHLNAFCEESSLNQSKTSSQMSVSSNIVDLDHQNQGKTSFEIDFKQIYGD